jgi:hypothetical protein
MPENRKRHKKVASPVSEPDLPQLIATLVEPFREELETPELFKTLVATACMAWNMANQPQTEWVGALSQVIAQMDLPEDASRQLAEVVLSLMKRKLELFSDDRRVINSYEVSEMQGRFLITVNQVVSAPV